jgi:hypothetical protein
MLKKPVNETKVDDEIVLKGSVRRSILPTTETEGLQIEVSQVFFLLNFIITPTISSLIYSLLLLLFKA